MLQLIAVYEGEFDSSPFAPFHRLDGTLTDDDVFAFLRALCQYGEPAIKPASPLEAATVLMARERQLIGGGLIAQEGDFLLVPGCCCGLEGWTEWEGLQQGAFGPWLGHDPAPWVDTSGPQPVLHADGGLNDEATTTSDAHAPLTLSSYEDLSRALAATRADLAGFHQRLADYLTSHCPRQARDLSARIAGWFSLPEALP